MTNQQMAYWIVEEVGRVNPYNRSGTNLKTEFYIYNMGFLASYLAHILREDPQQLRIFRKHLAQQAEQTKLKARQKS